VLLLPFGHYDVDQGFHLLHLQMVTLDDHPNTIPKTQQHQTLIFFDVNEDITTNQVFNQAFDVVSPRTRACNLPSIKGKSNKKITNRKICLFRGPLIIEAIKKKSQTTEEMELLEMQMTREITIQIFENEQARRKLLLEGQLQMATIFVEVLKHKNPLGHNKFKSDSIL
jgi:hypothetical protein